MRSPTGTSGRASLLVAASSALLIACGPGQDQPPTNGDPGAPAETERQEFAFTGTVQRIDTVTNIVAVANDEIPGWMMEMTMNYFVDPAEVIQTLQPGDRISARVYSGDFQNLYAVEVVPEN